MIKPILNTIYLVNQYHNQINARLWWHVLRMTEEARLQPPGGPMSGMVWAGTKRWYCSTFFCVMKTRPVPQNTDPC